MECPVCTKKFSITKIEEHVEECISTINNDKNTESVRPKRTFPFANSANDLPHKKQKIFSPGESTSKTSFGVSDNRAMEKKKEHVPLAERLRPANLETYVGQEKLLGDDALLRKLLNNGQVTSMIFWGPPGCGKTSLANVIAKRAKTSQGKARFVKLSATSSGIADIRETVASAIKESKLGIRTILFMDEIHRFNKLQQDIFLPHVEAGTFVLIGATTENPSFSLNSALLSRCRVFIFEKLSKEDTMLILKKGISSLKGVLCAVSEGSAQGEASLASQIQDFNADKPEFSIDEEAADWLAETCNGDARVALTSLELAVKTKVSAKQKLAAPKKLESIVKLSIKDLKIGLEQTHTLHSGKSDYKYDLIAAMHKSISAGHSNASLYWLARLMAFGEDPVYIARRLVRIASEDIGLADPEALDIAVHTMNACQMIGMPECDVMLSQCAVYMAQALKSRSVDDALRRSYKTIMEYKGPQPSVPLHIRCRGGEGKLQASLGAAKIHLLRKQDQGERSCLPAGLKNIDFFN